MDLQATGFFGLDWPYNVNTMSRILKSFQGLRWKLTLSYTLVTVAALLAVMLIATVLVWILVTNSNIYPRALVAVVREELAPQIVGFLDNSDPDINGLAGWLQAAETSAGLTFQSLNYPVAEVSLSDFDENTLLLVLDKNLNLLAGVPTSMEENFRIVVDEADRAVAAALSGEDDVEQISQITPNGSITIAVPVMDEDREILGIVVLKTVFPPRGMLVGMFSAFGGSLVLLAIAAGLVGTVFGFLTARGLTRRIGNITQRADSWSQGNFSEFINDHSADELGQMSESLNRMAEQLQNLLHTRQELAAMEERNKLARDLHDSVKQQVFAAAMQLGAVRATLEAESATTLEHLTEAQKLTQQAQEELDALIRELRPATLQEGCLTDALKEYAEGWSRQNLIVSEVRGPVECDLPQEVEDALFRIAQEGLANIAKHSGATRVGILLTVNNREVAMSIRDDGSGFDVAAVGGEGVGLGSMKERMVSIGGTFDLESEPGRGTLIHARWQKISGDPDE